MGLQPELGLWSQRWLGLLLVVVLVLLLMGYIPRGLTEYDCEKEYAEDRYDREDSAACGKKDCRGINGALAAQEQRVL